MSKTLKPSAPVQGDEVATDMTDRKLPSYYVSSTLLYSEPDANRRTIYRSADDTPVAVFNREMRPWTEQMDREMRWCLAALLSLEQGNITVMEALFPIP